MQSGEFDRFALGMAKLMLAYDKKLTEARIDMYWDRLKDVPLQTFEESVPIIIDQATSFPRVAVVRKACDEAERRRQWRADQYVVPVGEWDEFCAECSDTGWVYGMMWAAIYGAEIRCVHPCKCRKGNPVFRAKLGAQRNALKPDGRFGGTLFD